MLSIFGTPVYTSTSFVERVFNPRSPSRAKRRAARGFPQHQVLRPDPKIYQISGAMHMHPATYEKLHKEIAKANVGK